MVDIPPEIVSDILRRLPAKSLCRFKTVSKRWLSLISQPKFHKDHLSTVKLTRLICDPKFSNPGPICTLPLHNQETPKLSLCSDNTESIFFFSHGSCNGLVLGTAFLDYGDNKSRVFDHLVILNPTTKEYVKLSETDYETFDNFTDHRCGIGYDSVTDDYKVVTLAYYHTRNRDPSLPIYVHVYSLKTNTWRRLADYPYPYDHYNDFINQEKVSGVLVNGCLHWIATKLVDNVLVRVIVGFSLADETFNEVPSPDVDILSNKRICKLGAFDEKLGIFVGDGVWLMKDYGVGDSWSKITINGFDETSNMSNISYVTPVIHFEDGKIMLVSDKLSRVYDVEEEFFIKSVDISRDIEGIARCTYVESLVSLKSSSRLTIHRLTSSHGIEPATPQAATGSKTVFMGNLSYSIKENDIKKFFKDAGEVVEILFSERDGRFAGYGHVEFATQEAAKKALELNGESLLDRKVKLDMVKERGPGNGSAQKSGQSKRPTIFVSGFGTDGGFDTIRSTLEEHFGQCGQISRMSIPKDFESGEPKGIAFIDFSDSASLSKALELSGTEVAGGTITVEEAKPRDGGRGGGRGRSGGRGVSRDGGTSGGRGRSDGRGRFRDGGRDGGRGGRGHGCHGRY